MRAELLAARLTPKGPSYENVGRSTRGYDELAAYLGRVSGPAWLFAQIVYFGEATEQNIYRLYLNVLQRVSDGWEPIGVKPAGEEAIKRWQERNGGLIEKLTRMAVKEALNPTIGLPNKAKWRAEQLGLSERRWHQEYRARYDRITAVINDWDGEFCGKVAVNQRALEDA